MKRFTASLAKIRQEHPLINEKIRKINKDSIRSLLNSIKLCQEEKFLDYVKKLNFDQLSLIFPCILKAQDGLSLDRIFKIIELRYNWYMYAIAWQTLSGNFQNEALFQAFQYICRLLRDDEDTYDQKPYFIACDFCHSLYDDMNQEDFFDLLVEKTEGLSYKQLEQLRKNYNLDENSNLFLQMLSRYFLTCTASDIYFYRQKIPIISNYYSQQEILDFLTIVSDNKENQNREILNTEQIKDLAKIIISQYSCVNPVAPLWKRCDKKIYKFFLNINLEFIIKDHCSVQENKLKFYYQLLPLITDLQKPDSDSLALRFNNFIIIDNRLNPFIVYFYTINDVENLFSQTYEIRDLSFPSFEMPQFNFKNNDLSFYQNHYGENIKWINQIPSRCRLMIAEKDLEDAVNFIKKAHKNLK